MDFPDSGSVVAKEPCPKCGSRDNVAVYQDGHKHCFGMGCDYHTNATGHASVNPGRHRQSMTGQQIEGEFRALPPRALSADACRKFGVRVGKLGNETVLVMDYSDGDNVVAQKVRKADKSFVILGDAKKMGLFGQHLWSPNPNINVIVTEGELDAVAMAQAQDLKWPVVSIPNGAANARKDTAKAREWLEGFKSVILCFDADEAGREATAAAASVLTPGKVRVITLPPGCKDANEAVIKGLEAPLIQAMWSARVWRPDGIVTVTEVKERTLAEVAMGRSYPFKGPTEATFGRHPGDVIGFGGGTGCGKSDLMAQMIDWDTRVLGIKTGVLMLEQNVAETVKRIAGKAAGKVFHAPDGSWSQDELVAAVESLEARDNLFLYDNWGAMDWTTIRARIRYMVTVQGVEHVYLDHLTALAAVEKDERVALEGIMAELAGDAQSLRMVMHYVSHLATPEGKSHEEGGRVMSKHFKGSRSIQNWSHTMWGLERDTQCEDPERRNVATLRCLKDRLTGRALGKTWLLNYDPLTGLSNETTREALGFTDATQEAAAEAGL